MTEKEVKTETKEHYEHMENLRRMDIEMMKMSSKNNITVYVFIMWFISVLSLLVLTFLRG